MAGSNNDDLPMMDFPMDAAAFNQACAIAGYSTFSLDKVMAHALVGDVTRRAGCVKIGRATLLLANERIDNYLGEVDKILEEGDMTPDAKASLIRSAGYLLTRKIETARSLLSSAKIDFTDGAKMSGPLPSFLPKTKVVPLRQKELTVDVSSSPQATGDGHDPGL